MLLETSGNGGHSSSVASKLCLHKSFAVCQGKPTSEKLHYQAPAFIFHCYNSPGRVFTRAV